MSTSQRVKLDDEELVSLIFGQRRLATKLRGDLRSFERKGAPEGLVHDTGRQLVVARKLHDRLMQIATSRGVTVESRSEPLL